jgi:hypothetical protein
MLSLFWSKWLRITQDTVNGAELAKYFVERRHDEFSKESPSSFESCDCFLTLKSMKHLDTESAIVCFI